MTVVTDIARGELLEVEGGGDQLDVLASYDGRTYRVGVQNRYEAPTLVSLQVGPETCDWRVSEVRDDGLVAADPAALRRGRPIDAAPWTLYYAECDELVGEPLPVYVPRADR
jgi:hypothetical protein